MKTKDTSVQCAFHPALTAFLMGLDQYWRDMYGEELVITSGSEPEARHGYTSLHYATPAQAADIRSWVQGKLPSATEQADEMRKVASIYCTNLKIPADWMEVILESDHIHIEYQPKRTL